MAPPVPADKRVILIPIDDSEVMLSESNTILLLLIINVVF